MNPVRIAMWSGPRTVSTAMLRAWENRPDTVVVDEPLYAAYLAATGLDHPGRDEVLAAQSTDADAVLTALAEGPVPGGAAVWFQKHMSHHLLPAMDRSRLVGLRHAYLLREPRALLASYARVRADPTLADLGLAQQVELYETFGGPVVDSADVLRDPEGVLRQLCETLTVPFEPAMLAWPAGPRDTDGVWAPHWYDAVVASTGFAPYVAREVGLPPRLEQLAEQCQPYYDRLAAYRLPPTGGH